MPWAIRSAARGHRHGRPLRPFRAAIWPAMDVRENRGRRKRISANPLQPQKREKEEKQGWGAPESGLQQRMGGRLRA